MKILVYGPLSDTGRQCITESLTADGQEVIYRLADDATDEDLATADIILIDGSPLGQRELSRASRLKLVQRLGTGSFDVSGETRLCAERGIPVNRPPGGLASWSTAEHTVMVILALLRRLSDSERAVRQSRWSASVNPMDGLPRDLRGRTVGLVGAGRVARHVARLLGPFNTRVIYARRNPGGESVAGAEQVPLPDLAAQADVMSLHVRMDLADKPLIDSAILTAMRAGTYLVNTSRGNVVDNSALAALLTSGHIAGAALDVFDEEPLAPNSPLRHCPNVVLTPHVAGRSRDVALEYYRHGCRNVLQFVAAAERHDID
jgi:D-3-phosphoglycerate dehydrogenase